MRFKLESNFEEGFSVDSICKGCGNNKSECTCGKKEIRDRDKHFLVFRFEKRKGKPVTLVGEFYISKSESELLSKKVKSKLSRGGSLKDGWLQIQGDCKDEIKKILLEEGFKFKNR